MSLNFFPARIPIGRAVLPDGTEVAVTATAEYWRAMAAMFERVGGANGTSITDFEILAAFGQLSAAGDSAGHTVGVQDAFQLPPVQVEPPPQFDQPDLAARVAELEKRLAESELKLAIAGDQVAMAAELLNRVEDLARLISLEELPQVEIELRKTVMALEIQAAFAPPTTDWEHPGSIGAKTANSGAFTSLSASDQITSTVSIGTAPFVVASTTKVSNLNADMLDGTDWTAPGTIGGVTPGSATFTTANTTGNLGAGLTASFRLHVRRGSSGVSSVFEGTNGNYQVYIEHDETNNIQYLGSSGSGARPLGFKVGNSEAARITTNGVLLVGTTTEGSVNAGSLVAAADLAHRGTRIGYFSAAMSTKLTVTGSRGGNAALASLLTQLATYGLITDSSSA
jgi:lipoprotein-anchoring transpeptidase ErfK/SrfK